MEETRWLTDYEARAWRAYVLATRLLFGQLERDLQGQAGLPLIDYEILNVLSTMPDRAMRMSGLALVEQISASRLSHAVSRLEEKGWVRRELCPSDRRGWMAVLTDEGFAVLEAAAPHHVNSVREHIIDQLTPEQLRQLQTIGDRLLGHLAPSLNLGCDAASVTSVASLPVSISPVSKPSPARRAGNKVDAGE